VLRAVAAGVALLCLVAGVLGLVRADEGLVRVAGVVDGVPLETVAPAGAVGRGPGVVVVHGFAGSVPLMRGFSDTLARHGVTVVLLDLAGHGASRRPFDRAGLDGDLRTALGHLRDGPGVDPARVGLVGHSLGAGVVLRGAAADPAVAATVAISTGGGEATGVRNLLVLAGGLEQERIRAAGPALTGLGAPDVTAGDPAAGTARRFAEVPGVEHVSVLFAPATHRAVVDWFGPALGVAPGPELLPLHRAGPALLLHLAALLGTAVATAVLLPRRPAGPDVAGGALATLAAPVLSVAAAALVLRAVPAGWLPVEVADYAIGFLGATGAVLLLLARLRPRPAAAPPAPRPRTVAVTVLLTALTVAGFAVPAHLGWAHSLPSGVRVGLLVPAFAAAALLTGGLEAWARGRGPARAAAVHAWGALAVVLGLVAAVVAGAPSFVLFVAPLFAVLLVWQGVLAAALRARAAPLPAVAVVGGALLGWPLALTFPVTA
jgi:dienelactone hydrolase